MYKFEIVESHIDRIMPGDTVEIDGTHITVCKKDIRRGGFMGTTIFGDNYMLGRRPVRRVAIFHAKPVAAGGRPLSGIDD